MNKSNLILRTRFIDRASHWFMVICFFMVALSGLSWFFPSLNWLNGVFGTPQLARILHPFLGAVVFVVLMFLFVRFVKYNLPERQDALWFRNLRTVLAGDHDQPLQIGKYNAGQKLLFWTLLACMLVLLISGVVIWRAYFSHFFGIDAIRLAALLHALAAFVLVLSIIVHIYAGIWIKGSIGAMLHGWVSRAWARKHHELWSRDVTGDKTPPNPGRKEG